MPFRIGNSPSSWGVEFAGDPRNPPWRVMLAECAAAGYEGVELGPVGYLPEDPPRLGDALEEFGLTLTGGVTFRATMILPPGPRRSTARSAPRGH